MRSPQIDAEAAGLEDILISQVGLDQLQARIYLLVNCKGMMAPDEMAAELEVVPESAAGAAQHLMDLGAFIDMPGGKFEAMHPRFTAVNMYRRRCEQSGIKFGRNNAIDGMGALLEAHYDNARTK